MAAFARSTDLRGAEFTGADLRRARFAEADRSTPIGQPNAGYETNGNDMPVFTTVTPSYAEVLEARAGRVVAAYAAAVPAADQPMGGRACARSMLVLPITLIPGKRILGSRSAIVVSALTEWPLPRCGHRAGELRSG